MSDLLRLLAHLYVRARYC